MMKVGGASRDAGLKVGGKKSVGVVGWRSVPQGGTKGAAYGLKEEGAGSSIPLRTDLRSRG